jgi:hypothetical protein
MPSVVTIGPALDGTPGLMSVAFDLASVGYETSEHIVSGIAPAYEEAEPRREDGRWSSRPTADAEFTTRIVIHRPREVARANGTVVVEWLNVTGGLDVPAVLMPTHRQLFRSGCTWVGVSVQRVGIEGGGIMPGMGLKDTDPRRYGGLSHPGDAHAFGIFGSVGAALPAFLRDTHGLPVERLLATGASQSAFYLTTYVNALDAGDEVYDGFLLQGRAGAGAPIDGFAPESINPANAQTAAARRARLTGADVIRDGGRVPVVVVQSETDVFGALAYLPARQPDGARFRLWEVAGSSHCDTYFLGASPRDDGSLPAAEMLRLLGDTRPDGFGLPVPMNSGPQMHYVLQRAFDALDAWVRDGVAPPSADRIELDGDGPARDEHGIARGGIRTPWVDAPVATLSGLGQPGHLVDLFGSTRAFDASELERRYPGGRDEYVDQFVAAARAAIDAGFVLEADRSEMEALGAAAWPTP